MTAVRWPVRAWIVAEILFGAVGASAVLVAPDRAAENFAWPVRPAVAAGVIGAMYGSVAVMLAVALFARTWEQVRGVVVAAAMLTSIMLLATVLHWEQFLVGSPAFTVWLVSYVLPPPTLAALYLWQQRRAVPYGRDVTEPLSRRWRGWLAVSGAVHMAGWSVLFVVPDLLAGPWPMSPLLVRVLAGWFVGYGLLQALMAAENDRRRSQIGLVWLVALPPLLAVQFSRFADQVDWRNPWLLAQLAAIALLGLAAVIRWTRRVAARHLAAGAAAAIGAFLVVLAIIPVLRPDLDVRARWVGEYAQGSVGWLMTAAYVALGCGAIALAAGLRDATSASRFGRAGRALLVVAGLGSFVAALLPQNPTDGTPGTPAGALRDLLLIPTFGCLLGALASLAVALRRRPDRRLEWRRAGTAVAWGTVAVVLALALSFAVPAAGRGLAGRYFDATWAILLLGLAVKVATHRDDVDTPTADVTLPDREAERALQ